MCEVGARLRGSLGNGTVAGVRSWGVCCGRVCGGYRDAVQAIVLAMRAKDFMLGGLVWDWCYTVVRVERSDWWMGWRYGMMCSKAMHGEDGRFKYSGRHSAPFVDDRLEYEKWSLGPSLSETAS